MWPADVRFTEITECTGFHRVTILLVQHAHRHAGHHHVNRNDSDNTPAPTLLAMLIRKGAFVDLGIGLRPDLPDLTVHCIQQLVKLFLHPLLHGFGQVFESVGNIRAFPGDPFTGIRSLTRCE